MYSLNKPKYSYTCVRCGEKRQSVDKARFICMKCSKWGKAGIGQTDIFGGIVNK